MIIISLTSYPPESAKEVGKRFLEFPPLPDHIAMKGPYINSVIGEGIKGITIYEFDDSKYPEASKFLNERVTSLFGVPGYTYTIAHWLEAQDALKLVGLA